MRAGLRELLQEGRYRGRPSQEKSNGEKGDDIISYGKALCGGGG